MIRNQEGKSDSLRYDRKQAFNGNIYLFHFHKVGNIYQIPPIAFPCCLFLFQDFGIRHRLLVSDAGHCNVQQGNCTFQSKAGGQDCVRRQLPF